MVFWEAHAAWFDIVTQILAICAEIRKCIVTVHSQLHTTIVRAALKLYLKQRVKAQVRLIILSSSLFHRVMIA